MASCWKCVAITMVVVAASCSVAAGKPNHAAGRHNSLQPDRSVAGTHVAELRFRGTRAQTKVLMKAGDTTVTAISRAAAHTRAGAQSHAAAAASAGVAALDALPNPALTFLPGPFATHDAAKAACTASGSGRALCTLSQLHDAKALGTRQCRWGWFHNPARDAMVCSCSDLYCTPDNCLHGLPSTTSPASTNPTGAYCCSAVSATAAAAAGSDVAGLPSCPAACKRPWLGDGWCDPECNSAACRYDHGDCCESTCENTCATPYACGRNGYSCLAPSLTRRSGGGGTTTVSAAADQDFSFLKKLHHTEQFQRSVRADGTRVVMLRRGQPAFVRVTVEGSTPVSALHFRLSLKVPSGSPAYTITGTPEAVAPVTYEGPACKLPFDYGGRVYFGCTSADHTRQWCYVNAAQTVYGHCKAASESQLRLLTFDIPVAAPVGTYELTVGGATVSSTLKFGVVFNPYLAADATYMADAAQRKEYVEADSATIFQGSAAAYVDWAYDQFTVDARVSVLNFLDTLTAAQRATPVTAAREASHYIGNVLLEGRWGAPYSAPPNTAPTSWLGSGQVLEKWRASGQRVKYGQCWVFSGVFTTFGRLLGIPTRTDCNVRSAHDVQPFDLYTDSFYVLRDGVFQLDSSMSHDSVWNYHELTLMYFRRDDVPQSSGWQIVDATPQERSTDKRYVMGPASLSRVKALSQQLRAGALDDDKGTCFSLASVRSCSRKLDWITAHTKSYDEAFAVGESSATNRVFTVVDGVTALYSVSHTWVGPSVLTQKVGGDVGEYTDVVREYKDVPAAASSSSSSRFAVTAGHHASGAYVSQDFQGTGDVTVKLVVPTTPVPMGGSFVVGVSITSRAKAPVSVHVGVRGGMVTEKGGTSAALQSGAPVVQHTRVVSVPAGGTVREVTTVTLRQYLKYLGDDHLVDLTVSAHVPATKFLFLEPAVAVPIAIPRLNVSLSVPSDQHLQARVQWRNPTKVTLEDCVLNAHVSGTSLTATEDVGDVAGLAALDESLVFHVTSLGLHSVTAAMTCKALTDVHGSASADLRP